MSSRSTQTFVSLLATLIAGAYSSSAFDDVGTRDIILKNFRNERPAPEKIRNAAASKTKGAGPAIIGLTLWRMRPSVASDPVKVRGLVHQPERPDNADVWTPERVSMQDALSDGQYIRISLESARRGYLYVIDRDIYSDGSSSPPTLIFPTLSLRGGDNRVEPGVLIEIPDAQDRPPVFTLKKTRADQVSLKLTLVVSPQPLQNVRITPEEQTLSAGQVATWEKEWGAPAEQVEDSASVGKPYTLVEQTAAKPNPQPLGPNDPIPVTLMKTKTPPGQTLLVSFEIKLK